MKAAAASDVLHSLRKRGGERFTALGWPTPRLEEWKYTNLAPLTKVQWRHAEEPSAVPADVTARLAGRAVIELIFVNGRLAESSGDGSSMVRNLASDPGAAVDEHLGSVADADRQALIALNTSQFVDGALVEVPAGKVVEGFIHLLFIGSGDGIWSHPRNLIIAGPNSQVAVVETYIGSGSYFTNAVTEMIAGDGAVIDHYRLVRESMSAYHTGAIALHQKRASSVTSHSIAAGGALIRNDVHVVLAGEGASLSLDGLFVGTGDQHIDNHTVIDHASPHCDSQELYKGILDDKSRGVFDGRIVVRPLAQKTTSRQENHNLLLSESAIIDSKPTLEIHNDDVKCNHGSTIGQIEEDTMFYLCSRGIGEEDARNLLVLGFASEIVDRMKIEPVREQIRRALFEQMPNRLPERREEKR